MDCLDHCSCSQEGVFRRDGCSLSPTTGHDQDDLTSTGQRASEFRINLRGEGNPAERGPAHQVMSFLRGGERVLVSAPCPSNVGTGTAQTSWTMTTDLLCSSEWTSWPPRPAAPYPTQSDASWQGCRTIRTSISSSAVGAGLMVPYPRRRPTLLCQTPPFHLTFLSIFYRLSRG